MTTMELVDEKEGPMPSSAPGGDGSSGPRPAPVFEVGGSSTYPLKSSGRYAPDGQAGLL